MRYCLATLSTIILRSFYVVLTIQSNIICIPLCSSSVLLTKHCPLNVVLLKFSFLSSSVVSCQELAALLAEHLSDDDSTKDEEYISYSPRLLTTSFTTKRFGRCLRLNNLTQHFVF